MSKKETRYAHTVDLLRLYDRFERQGPDGITLLGVARRFADLPKKVRTNVIVQMDIEMQELSRHRGKPYQMPPKAYKHAVEKGRLISPADKKPLKAWRKVRTRALEQVAKQLRRHTAPVREL